MSRIPFGSARSSGFFQGGQLERRHHTLSGLAGLGQWRALELGLRRDDRPETEQLVGLGMAGPRSE